MTICLGSSVVEQATENRCVGSSILPPGTTPPLYYIIFITPLVRFCVAMFCLRARYWVRSSGRRAIGRKKALANNDQSLKSKSLILNSSLWERLIA